MIKTCFYTLYDWFFPPKFFCLHIFTAVFIVPCFVVSLLRFNCVLLRFSLCFIVFSLFLLCFTVFSIVLIEWEALWSILWNWKRQVYKKQNKNGANRAQTLSKKLSGERGGKSRSYGASVGYLWRTRPFKGEFTSMNANNRAFTSISYVQSENSLEPMKSKYCTLNSTAIVPSIVFP